MFWKPPKPPPVLAEVGAVDLRVHFTGTGPKDAELFVCGFAAEDYFSCVSYVDFEREAHGQ